LWCWLICFGDGKVNPCEMKKVRRHKGDLLIDCLMVCLICLLSERFELLAEDRSWADTVFALGGLLYGAVWVLIELFLKDAGKQSEKSDGTRLSPDLLKHLFLVLYRRQNA